MRLFPNWQSLLFMAGAVASYWGIPLIIQLDKDPNSVFALMMMLLFGFPAITFGLALIDTFRYGLCIFWAIIPPLGFWSTVTTYYNTSAHIYIAIVASAGVLGSLFGFCLERSERKAKAQKEAQRIARQRAAAAKQAEEELAAQAEKQLPENGSSPVKPNISEIDLYDSPLPPSDKTE